MMIIVKKSLTCIYVMIGKRKKMIGKWYNSHCGMVTLCLCPQNVKCEEFVQGNRSQEGYAAMIVQPAAVSTET